MSSILRRLDATTKTNARPRATYAIARTKPKNPIAKCCKVLACQLWKGLKQETLCDLVRVVLNCYLQEVRCNRCSCLHTSGGIHCSISNISVDQFSCSRQQHLVKLRPVFFYSASYWSTDAHSSAFPRTHALSKLYTNHNFRLLTDTGYYFWNF